MDAADEDTEFPQGAMLDGGRYQVVDHYLGGGSDQLWFARGVDSTTRYLVSTTVDNGFDLPSDGPALMRSAEGVLTPCFLGPVDLVGDGGVRDELRRTTMAYVERVPGGIPLVEVRLDVARHAFHLGSQVAERLLAAAAAEVLVVGVRPEYVWIEVNDDAPNVTGVGGGNRTFFTAAHRRRDLRTAPLFTRRYVAPEVSRGEAYDERALVFSVAVMTAEWLLGRYPYEGGDGAYGYNRLCRGEHVALPDAARELVPALSTAPAARPALSEFVRTLDRLAQRHAR
ncbi:MAG: hypothetical protein K8W52_03790 [Deltaproteobacteria bacterium]|nr:hypothetical protein [Deltaproteobacteria bacterium]